MPCGFDDGPDQLGDAFHGALGVAHEGMMSFLEGESEVIKLSCERAVGGEEPFG